MKKQEVTDLANKLGEDYETRSNDGHYSIVEKATGRKIARPGRPTPEAVFEATPVKDHLTIDQTELGTLGTAEEQPGEILTFKQLAMKFNTDQNALYWLIIKNLKANKTGPGRTARYIFSPEDIQKIKELLRK